MGTGAETDLIIEVSAKTDKAKAALTDLIKGQEGMSSGLAMAATAGVAAFAALVVGIGMSVQAFEEQQKAIRGMNLALQNQGMYTEELSKAYTDVAAALEKKTGVEEEAIIKGQTLLQSYIGQRKIAPELTESIVDMAAATGGDLNGAFNAAARAVETGTLSIGRFRIQLDPTLDKTERLAKVQEILGQKFGGAAAEAVKGLGGWALVQSELGDLSKMVGEQFAPMVVRGIELTKKALQWLVPIVKDIFAAWNLYWPKVYQTFSSTVYGLIQLGDGLGKMMSGVLNLDAGEIKEGWKIATEAYEAGIKDYEQAVEKGNENEIKTAEKQNQKKKDIADQAARDEAEADRIRVEMERLKQEVALLEMTESGSKQLELKKQQLGALEKAEKTHNAKMKAAFKAQAADTVKEAKALGTTLLAIDSFFHTEKMKALQSGMGEAAQMVQSKNATLKALGKAAAIADIVINTQASAMKIISGFSAIPFVGYSLGLAMAGAMIAYSGERIANVIGANQGGLIQGGTRGTDSVPAMLTPGELVVPAQNFQEVVDAYASGRGQAGSEGPGHAVVEIRLAGDFGKMVEASIVKSQRLNTSVLKRIT